MTRRINPETLAQIFKVLLSSSFISDEILFLWHAGEPLVLPIGFYERAFALQQEWNVKGVRISNAFQTNATLITQKWCQFFKAYDVHIGISLDGPRHIHDANRVDRAGRGTFDRIMRSIELLRAHDIKFAVIAVITKDTVQHADEFWRFFADLRPISLGLNPEESEGVNEHSSLRTEEDIRQYRQFFKRLVTLNEQSAHPLAIREIGRLMTNVKALSPHIRSQTNVPAIILSFDYEGNVSTFSPELLSVKHPVYGDFLFGNVFEGTLEDMFTHPKFLAVNEQIQRGVTRCRESCEYFTFCGGGSPSNKLHENGAFDSTETVACRLKVKAATDAMLEYLEEKYYIEPSPPQSDNTAMERVSLN